MSSKHKYFVAVFACVSIACNGMVGGVPNTDAGVGGPPADAPRPVQGTPVTEIPGHETLVQDSTPKEPLRLMPVETLIRSYLSLFGGLSPMEFQTRMRATGSDALFDTWADYLSALGVPDHAVDIPRGGQTNTLMLAAFERIGIALCDRAVQADLRGSVAVDRRVLFRFDVPANGTLDDAAFAMRLDALHRRFLGYPLAMAPAERTTRFRDLYRSTLARPMRPRTGFTGTEAAWASVCYGLVRHPEFHLY